MAKTPYLGARGDKQDIGNNFGDGRGAFWHGGANMNSIGSLMGKGLVVVGLLISTGSALAAGSDDGFATFWTQFRAAVSKSDQEAVSHMIKYPIEYDGQRQVNDFAMIWNDSFGPEQRKCLARQKAVKDPHEGKVSYVAVCEDIIYVFDKGDAGWKLTDFAVND